MSFTIVCYKYYKPGTTIKKCSKYQLHDTIFNSLLNFTNNDLSYINKIKFIHNNKGHKITYTSKNNKYSINKGINHIIKNCAFDGGNVFIEIHDF